AINKEYGRRISVVGGKQPYAGGVFYAKDAFEGLDIMDSLSNDNEKDNFIQKVKDEAIKFSMRSTDKKEPVIEEMSIQKSAVKELTESVSPPFWGVKTLNPEEIDLRDVFEHLSLSELFRLSWGGRGKSKEEYQKLIDSEFRPTLEKLQDDIIKNKTLLPKIVYGYFPCQSEGNTLSLYDPEDQGKLLVEFTFPRQKKEPHLCLSDYFKSKSSGGMDVIALQVVTVGDKASTICDELSEAGKYTESYYLHGLSVQTAEALASYSHSRILKELNLPEDRGKRYSFGYPACPELDDQTKFMEVLSVEKNIGVSLSEAFQLIPEQSTSALIIHHPDAVYYRVS
ncbi:MAG: methionine synthase, partial [Spirochaetota bacterium]|nr:methionine synthase [Spirochaetota bacterium]